MFFFDILYISSFVCLTFIRSRPVQSDSHLHEKLIVHNNSQNKEENILRKHLNKLVVHFWDINVNRSTLNITSWTVTVCLLIQGMGYLHAKGIVHKDLKSKNVFHDTNKVVITDFGLFGISGVVQEGRWETPLETLKTQPQLKCFSHHIIITWGGPVICTNC